MHSLSWRLDGKAKVHLQFCFQSASPKVRFSQTPNPFLVNYFHQMP
jgi:hypothetical protein